MSPLSVAVVFGTRPEAIKLAPVVRELRRRHEVRTRVIVTAQHRELLDQVLEDCQLRVDEDLNLMQADQTPSALAARALAGLERSLARLEADWVIVQGDTTTTVAGALAAYWGRRRVCHVEAGLRTGRRNTPWPEEMNRRLVGQIADLHCAPTDRARSSLLAEGVASDRIVVTGNPIVDSLEWMSRHRAAEVPAELERVIGDGPLVVLTLHRRENFGEPIERIIEAVEHICQLVPEVQFLWPLHPNPAVARPVWKKLGTHDRVHLIAPQPYASFLALVNRAEVLLTDSGGIQEEAAVLGKPVLILRDTTERPEVLTETNQLVGTDAARIELETVRLLLDPPPAAEAGSREHGLGDGKAAVRIVDALLAHEQKTRRVTTEWLADADDGSARSAPPFGARLRL